MMSDFFLSVSSDAARGDTRNGGHFIVDLHNEIRMPRGQWEMALMEMSYYNQSFPNIPNSTGHVTVLSPITPYTEFNYVISYPIIQNFFFRFEIGGPGNWRTLQEYTFPARHHSIYDLYRYVEGVRYWYDTGVNILEMKMNLQQLTVKSKMPPRYDGR